MPQKLVLFATCTWTKQHKDIIRTSPVLGHPNMEWDISKCTNICVGQESHFCPDKEESQEHNITITYDNMIMQIVCRCESEEL